ncbi:MAG TPA: YbaB/EbfC family nucleoid-associated protein [Myxococcota bacterium]|nr:YbaB/EbfC family nucleoid-associated protein [Myxococcota bacterium]
MLDPRKLLDMFKNVGEMQRTVLEKLKQQTASGEAGGGMVKVVMNGHLEVTSLTIDETVLKEDKAFVEELVKAAVNDTTAQLRNSLADHMKSFTGAMGF